MLNTYGYEVRKDLVQPDELEVLRRESESLSGTERSACVRRLTLKSIVFAEMAMEFGMRAGLPEDYIVVRSLLFDKTVEENWPVAWHQDMTIAVEEKIEHAGFHNWTLKDGVPHVQPPQPLLEAMFTIRVHLDHTPAANGALWVEPGSHLLGRLSEEDIRQIISSPEVIEANAGDALVMRPLLLHSSKRSVAPSRRRVIHCEYAPKEGLPEALVWHEGLHGEANQRSLKNSEGIGEEKSA